MTDTSLLLLTLLARVYNAGRADALREEADQFERQGLTKVRRHSHLLHLRAKADLIERGLA